MQRYILLLIVLLCGGVAKGQTDIHCEYWFDRDYSERVNLDISGEEFSGELDVEHLEVGLHTLSLHLRDTGQWSAPMSFMFFKPMSLSQEGASSPLTYKYWFDNSHESMQSLEAINGLILLPTDSLADGLHTLNLFVEHGNTLSSPQRYMFLKVSGVISDTDIASATYRCWFDRDYDSAQSGSVGNGTILLETEGLTSGLHTLNVLLEAGGTQTSTQSYMFVKVDNALSDTANGGTLAFSYWFDNDFANRKTGELQNGTILLETDSLPAGFHYVNIQVKDNDPFFLQRSLFYKEPLGGLGICKYEYWLNDDFDNRTTVEINPIVEQYNILALMPVDTAAFNQNSFVFEPRETTYPIVYSKNQIHFRFWNNLNYLTDTVRTYVDERVNRDVIADTIYRNTSELIATPTGNNIHWFVLDAEIGDSLAFKANHGCTLELYAPSGDRVMSVSDIKATNWKGLSARENGFYHLAVFNGPTNYANLNVSYSHVSKYAVLDYDVHLVGNAGYSNINFIGNGFNDLDTVLFINSMSDTLANIRIGHEGNTHTSVLFDFNGADTGLYDAVFFFTEDTIRINDAIRVEQARDIILVSDVSFPSSFTRGSTVTYTVTITNTGNMTAYNIPFYTYIGTEDSNAISYVKFDGLDLPNIFDGPMLDSLSESEREEWLEYGEEVIGDVHYFYPLKGLDEDTGDSVHILSNYFITTLAPYETKTLELKITSTGTVDVWFTIPDTIATYSHTPQMQYSEFAPPVMMANSSFAQHYCCAKEKIACFADAVGWLSGFAENILHLIAIGSATSGVGAGAAVPAEIAAQIAGAVSCASSMFSGLNQGISQMVCSGEEPSADFFENLLGGISQVSSYKSLIGCLPFSFIKKFLGSEGGILGSIVYDLTVDAPAVAVSCASAFTEKKPNCPPAPHNGGSSNAVAPVDPNDIYGYVAESGSKAVGSDVSDLFYGIQFENDTTMATSSASKVVLIDTLNAEVFDFSTFAATKVIIGSKEEIINGEREFVRTIDMRPEINSLAQISLTFDSLQGVARWEFTSLDPITLEETTNPDDGFLPINYDGEGMGEVLFNIKRKSSLADSTVISNYAAIIFDYNDPILTPVWQNVVDITPPQSSAANVSIIDSMATINNVSSTNLE